MSYKKSTVLQISGLNERTGGKSGIKSVENETHSKQFISVVNLKKNVKQ